MIGKFFAYAQFELSFRRDHHKEGGEFTAHIFFDAAVVAFAFPFAGSTLSLRITSSPARHAETPYDPPAPKYVAENAMLGAETIPAGTRGRNAQHPE
ncbi:hypothetical protein MnTg02_03025 [bacterium MnTg02]|nr:hypothetical protein MnTg02_03025 [bacterium MnTg02]